MANLSRDSQNYLTDNYILVTDRNKIETFVRNAIIEYNKEKPKINFPLYSVRFFFYLFEIIIFVFSVILNYYVVYVIQFKQLMDIVV